MRPQPADLLIVLAHHVGELDAFFPLIFLLRQSCPTWRTRVVVTKKSLMLQIGQSPALLAMMVSLEIDYRFVPVNAINEPAEFHRPDCMTAKNGSSWLLRFAGRMGSIFVMARSTPDLLCELRAHKTVSIEGTQYPILISLACLFARSDQRTVFLHNHSVQPILTLPRKAKLIFGKRYAKGIVFSDTELSRNLYGGELQKKTYRTGLLKYLPEWAAFCRAQVANKEAIAVGIFAKRISFEVYRKLLDALLLRLAQAGWECPVLIKPHPMDKPEAYNELLTAYPSLQLALTSEPNFALMPTLRAGICFPGSSILDCDAFGVPVIELRPATDTFGRGKVVPTDYADSGYLSSTETKYVVEWLMTVAAGQRSVSGETMPTRSCGTNELDSLITDLMVLKGPVLEK